MTEMSLKELSELREFLKWKRENPKEYELFLEDFKEFIKDMKLVMEELL